MLRWIAVATALLWAALPAQATVFPAEGGQGDRGEEYRCPVGHILIGFYGRTGSWIDQLGLICSEVLIPSYTTGRVVRQRPRGGNGGSPSEQYCARDAGIREIRRTFVGDPPGPLDLRNHDTRLLFVHSIAFSCARPRDGSVAESRTMAGDGNLGTSRWTIVDRSHAPDRCPGNEYATGLNIRYGSHVNAVGLICSAIANWPSTSNDTVPTQAPREAIDAGMEDNTDRPGSDYKRIELGNPKACQAQCKVESDRCRAWTYVRRGVQGPNAVCYLKNAQSDAKANSCCVSGVNKKVVGLGKKLPTPAGEVLAEGMENDTDRPGSDIHRLLQEANPGICSARCARLDRCKAWTYVRPGVQGPKAVCYLKNAAPPARPSKCCISGVKVGEAGPNAPDMPNDFPQPSPPRCQPGFVWREARATDYVCVTPESRSMVKQENAIAPTRWNPNGPYGAHTCIAGFVWREAFDGDVVCVTSERRTAVKEENRLGPSRTE